MTTIPAIVIVTVLSFNAAFSERVLGESQSENILFTRYDIFDVDILPWNMVIQHIVFLIFFTNAQPFG